MSRHPTDDALATWLETGRPTRVGRHVERCDACLSRAEAASHLGIDVRAGLDEAVAPAAELERRTADAVGDRLDDEEALSVLVDLFGLPWAVARAVLDRSPLGGGAAGTPTGRSPRHGTDPGEDVDRSRPTDG